MDTLLGKSIKAYTTQKNPIERSFAQLKAWMRTCKDLVHEYDNFLELITLSLDHFQRSRDPGAHFSIARIEYEKHAVEE